MTSVPPQGIPQPITDPAIEAALTTVANLLNEFEGNSLRTALFKKRGRPTADGLKSESPSTPNSGHYEYGRMFVHQGDLFVKVDNIVNLAIRHETKDSDSDDNTSLSNQNKRLLECWKSLCNLIPGFKTQMLELSADRQQRKSICKKITSGVKKARADNANSLKTRIVDYMLFKVPDVALSPPLSSSGSKTGRSWNHPEIAKFLCPIKYPATEETFTKIRQGELAVTAAMFPQFLFLDDQVYNRNDMSAGILRGHCLPRACQHIFQGPSTALQAPGTQCGNSGNAAITGLSAMTPRSIAYVAVQVRFALTSKLSWDTTDGQFGYSDFFWRVVGLFDDKEEAQGHLEHFNYEVFGSKDGVMPEKPTVVDEDDDFEVVRKQHEEKCAHISAAAGASATAFAGVDNS